MNEKDRQAIISEINELAIRYTNSEGTETKDVIFNDLYRKVTEMWRKENAILLLARRYQMSYEDAYSIALEKLYFTAEGFKSFEKEDGARTVFYHYLTKNISNAFIDYLRRKIKRSEHEVEAFEDSMESDPHLIKYIPRANEDGEDLDEYIKGSEQRQLLAQLLEKADDKCRQAVEAFSKTTSYHAASKELGISNHAVKRRIQKVAKLFDTSIYGDIHDYFTVPTTPSNQLVSQTEVSAS